MTVNRLQSFQVDRQWVSVSAIQVSTYSIWRNLTFTTLSLVQSAFTFLHSVQSDSHQALVSSNWPSGHFSWCNLTLTRLHLVQSDLLHASVREFWLSPGFRHSNMTVTRLHPMQYHRHQNSVRAICPSPGLSHCGQCHLTLKTVWSV